MEKEYVSFCVSKESAKRLYELKERNSEEEAVEEFIKEMKDQSTNEFKTNLESLEEDVAVYKGLMIKVKKEFRDAKDEQLQASYKVWEDFEEQLPSIRGKIKKLINELTPLEEQLNRIEKMMSNIRTWDMEKVLKIVEKFSSLCGKESKMMNFLINNFNDEKE